MGSSAAPALRGGELTGPALGVGHDIKVHPGAAHGFINDHDPADMTLLLTFLTRSPPPATTSRLPATPTAASPPSSAVTRRADRQSLGSMARRW